MDIISYGHRRLTSPVKTAEPARDRMSFIYIYSYLFMLGWDGSVGIATLFGLDGPGMESQWTRDFPHSSRQALGPTQPPIQWVFPGCKSAAAGVGHPLPFSVEVKKSVELYLYSTSGLSWPVLG